MKKILIVLSVLTCVVTSSIHASDPGPFSYKSTVEWMKSKTQTWPGMFEGETYWYKIDKMAKLWWSKDGKSWAVVKSGSWSDKDGKWLKINDGNLAWSKDGNQWSDVPEWKWEGSDGVWYKFDKKWKLWENK